MEPHDSRALDAAIDHVARAMTRAGLARDLRPAIAARLGARQPWWPVGWRMAAAAMAAVVVVVAVVSRSSVGPQPAPPRVESRGASPVIARATTPVAPPLAVCPERRVVRETIDRADESAAVVVIRPVAIVPLADDDVGLEEMEPARFVEIAPIDVEPVRIGGLELVE